MRQVSRETLLPLYGAVILAALAACSPEAITSDALNPRALPVASVGPADTGLIAREKWLLRLQSQEAAIAGPNRWFSLQPRSVDAIRTSRALVTAPKAATEMLTDDGAESWVVQGGTSVSLVSSNIVVLTAFNTAVPYLLGQGSYNVYYNAKASGGASYATGAPNVSLISQPVSLSVSGAATDTIDVNASTTHSIRIGTGPFTPENGWYAPAHSFGHDRYAPALAPPSQIDYESYGGGGPDGASEGVGCWYHYRSYDGGYSWYLLSVTCADEGAGKSIGLVSRGATLSGSTTGAPPIESTANSARPARPATFVVLGQDQLQGGQRAVVYLRPGMSPEAVIAIDRKNARPSDIAEGVAAMMKLRTDAALRGDNGFYRTIVKRTARIVPALSASGQGRFGGYLAAMKRAPSVNVPGVGTGNAVEVQMPTGR